jgi:hypothetical protein
LEAAVVRRRNWHGCARLGALSRVVQGGAVSGAEFVLHSMLGEAGLTGWSAGVSIADSAGVIGVVDLLFAGARVIVEVDGWRADSSRRSFVADRRRQNRLIAAGYTVLRFTWDDLTTRRTDVISQIRCAVFRASTC